MAEEVETYYFIDAECTVVGNNTQEVKRINGIFKFKTPADIENAMIVNFGVSFLFSNYSYSINYKNIQRL